MHGVHIVVRRRTRFGRDFHEIEYNGAESLPVLIAREQEAARSLVTEACWISAFAR
jgi:hypothetical protein